MKNLEVPLYLVESEEQGRSELDIITHAHLMYLGLKEDEYHEEAPDSQILTAQQLFACLGGLTWRKRKEQINIHHQMKRLPKCVDVPLALASDGEINQARWLVERMIDQNILNESISQHQDFFEQADAKEEAFGQIAEAEAERRRKEVIQDLRRHS